jgi:hypothetical protein
LNSLVLQESQEMQGGGAKRVCNDSHFGVTMIQAKQERGEEPSDQLQSHIVASPLRILSPLVLRYPALFIPRFFGSSSLITAVFYTISFQFCNYHERSQPKFSTPKLFCFALAGWRASRRFFVYEFISAQASILYDCSEHIVQSISYRDRRFYFAAVGLFTIATLLCNDPSPGIRRSDKIKR